MKQYPVPGGGERMRNLSIIYRTIAAVAVVVVFALGLWGAPARGQMASATLYISGDTNMQDMFNKDLLPLFERDTSVKTTLVFLSHGIGYEAVLAKIIAAKRTGRQTDVDLFETQPTQFAETASEGIWAKITKDNVPNSAKVDPQRPEVLVSGGFGLPYRGSSVVLAYNSKYVTDPPKTYDDIIAWIKKNPGKFTYCDPQTCGSGQAFLYVALYKSGKSADFTGVAYDASKEVAWKPALELLRSLKPAIYNNGFYPNGNVAVLQLLGRENIWMAPVWSDLGMSYLDQGLLPKTVKLVQVSPPFTGGDSAIGIPVNAEHQGAGMMFLNWLLTSKAQTIVVNKLVGYPGIEWKYMPKDVRDRFAGIAGNFSPLPNAKYQADAKRLWQEQVAGSGQ
jgi:putative spermidine/putrescine transport system substrate-binding protein